MPTSSSSRQSLSRTPFDLAVTRLRSMVAVFALSVGFTVSLYVISLSTLPVLGSLIRSVVIAKLLLSGVVSLVRIR